MIGMDRNLLHEVLNFIDRIDHYYVSRLFLELFDLDSSRSF